MPLDPSKIEVMDERMAEVYRNKTPAERLAIAHGMWRYARERIEATVRREYPDWDRQAVNGEVARRLLNGPGATPELPPRRS